jgi:hypothetical protein
MRTPKSLGAILFGACALVAMTLPVGATSLAAVGHGPNRRVGRVAAWPGSTSGNWSGYARIASAGKLTFASATWKVPSVQAKTGYSASWVGIDGATNSQLIQTGTEQDFAGGHTIYRAWWEILPAAETIIPSLTIQPGDTMTGSVQNTSANQWVITLKDVTSGQSFSIDETYKGPGRSAEWIEEAPSNGTKVLPLAHYSPTKFSKLQVGFDLGAPVSPHLGFPGMAIALVQNGKQVSTPSKPNAAGNAFTVSYGAKG